MNLLFRIIPNPSKLIIPALPLLLTISFGCSSNPNTASADDSTASAQTGGKSQNNDVIVPQKNPEGIIVFTGSVTELSAKTVTLKTKDKSLVIGFNDSTRIYASFPSDLSKVKGNSFIGVTTQKQKDNSDKASEIHIFPEELRGMGEGSYMMDEKPESNSSRMTNGSALMMTNGSASTMSNGNVKTTDGSSLIVQFQGKSCTVQVPKNTPVSEFKITDKKLKAGDIAFAIVKQNKDSSYYAKKMILPN